MKESYFMLIRKLKISLEPLSRKLQRMLFDHWSDIIVKFLFTALVFVFGGILGELCAHELSVSLKALLEAIFQNSQQLYYLVLLFAAVFIIVSIGAIFFIAGALHQLRINRHGMDYDTTKRELMSLFRRYRKSNSEKKIWFLGRACTDLFDAELFDEILRFNTRNDSGPLISVYIIKNDNIDIMRKLVDSERNVDWNNWVVKLEKKAKALIRFVDHKSMCSGNDNKEWSKLEDILHQILHNFASIRNEDREKQHFVAIECMKRYWNAINELGATKNLIEIHEISKLPSIRIWHFPNHGGICGIYLNEVSHSKFGLELPNFYYDDHRLSLPIKELEIYRDSL